MSSRVIVVEDEKDVRDLISIHLKRENYKTSSVEDGENALKLLLQEPYDLAILDWMLPGLSGLEICKKIRNSQNPNQNIPVLMVTARADTNDIILGLEMGADDYLTKPFEISVFTARVRALLRRASHITDTKKSIYKIEGLVLNLETHQVTCDNQKVDLTPSEFKLLAALIENQGRVCSRDKLIELVQGEGVAVIDRTVDTHIFGVRKKLGNCSEIIETIRGVGYRIKN